MIANTRPGLFRGQCKVPGNQYDAGNKTMTKLRSHNQMRVTGLKKGTVDKRAGYTHNT
jgi:hypothetical protein